MAVVLIAACSCGPSVAPPANITVDSSPERVARGKYLYTVVADCDNCHGERDFSRLYGPVTASGKGGVLVLQGLPGKIVAPNLTPDTHLRTHQRGPRRLPGVFTAGLGSHLSGQRGKVVPAPEGVIDFRSIRSQTSAVWPGCAIFWAEFVAPESGI